MAKKKFKLGFKIVNDGVASVSVALISIIFFVCNTFIFKGKLTSLFLSAPTAAGGELPFIVSGPLSYIRILMYIFGSYNINSFMIPCCLICLFGPVLEERYGSLIIGIMMIVSGIFSGVLNACFCQKMSSGLSCVVFMMLFLSAFFSLSKKKIPLSFIFVVGFYIFMDLFLFNNPNGFVGVIIEIAGGLCGSLFAFLASPKARAEKKATKGTDLSGTLSKEEKEAYLEELDSQSPRNKKNKRKNDDDDDATVVGTLTF